MQCVLTNNYLYSASSLHSGSNTIPKEEFNFSILLGV